MPTFISHAIVSAPISLGLTPGKKEIFLLSLIFSVLPDFDGIGYYLGIPYEHFLGHRGFSHSIFFVLIAALFFTSFTINNKYIQAKQSRLLFLNFFIIGLSHIFLDAMTDGGLGVALFSPFYNARFFLPWQPIMVSGIYPQTFLSLRGLAVFKNEILYLIIPSLIMSAIIFLYKKRKIYKLKLKQK